METFCDPETESWEWHDSDAWHSSEPRQKLDRSEFTRTATAVRRALTPEYLVVQFDLLVASWRNETENLSSFTRIVRNSSYQQIIGLGKDNPSLIVPMILNDLKGGGGHWATALQAITGESPVKPEHIGNQKSIGADWLSWGRQHGYV